MSEYITLAHDSVKSGTWEPKKPATPTLDDLKKAVDDLNADERCEAFERGYLEGQIAEKTAGKLDFDKSRSHTEPMNDITDYRHELKLRDESLRRELDLRQDSFRAEQAVRDKALEDRFSGFLASQVERDKAWEKISDARFDRIEKDVSSIKSDTKKVADEVSDIKLTMAKYLGAAIVIGAIASAILGATAKHLLG